MTNTKKLLIRGAALLMAVFAASSTAAQPPGTFVRIAELEIDAPQLENFKAAVTEGMEASVRTEPGVIAIYAVAIKGAQNHLRFFEIYTDEKAYESHRETTHFKKYFETTKGMIKSRKLIETEPLLLMDKASLPAKKI